LSVRFKNLLLFTALAAPAGLAIAQTGAARPVPQPQATRPVATQPAATQPVTPQPAAPRPAAQGVPQPGIPQPVIMPAPEVVPPPPPPPVWTLADANQLLLSILNSAKDGLDPTDYDAAGLMSAMRSNDPNLLSAAATERFDKLASDFALGHVRGDDRQNWHIPDPDLDPARRDALLRASLAQHRVGEALQGLLPTHPQYAALRKALEITPKTETGKIDRIRLNMDRWRWLPRDLGERYIIVNVPAYTAALVENGVTVSRHRAVAGAIKTPTPQLMATATGVILNPWWEVPKSIEPEVRGKAGYVPLKGADGKIQRWRQPPGPRNALGQIKFVMYNPQNIYLHDTTAKTSSTRRRAPTATAASAPSTSFCWPRSCLRKAPISRPPTGRFPRFGLRSGSRRRSSARRPCRRTSRSRFPSTSSTCRPPLCRTGRSRTMPTSTRRTARSLRR
jgi:hypothetical protein